MFSIFILASLITSVKSLDPAQIKISVIGDESHDWDLLNAPSSCPANTPRFEFGVSSRETLNETLTFVASGSLGLKNHPLGVFKFQDSGNAEDSVVLYILDGVLGKISMNFEGGHDSSSKFKINFRVDVWTVIPSLPPFISTGFEVKMSLKNSKNDTVMNMVVSISQPATSGAEKSQDVCQTDSTNFPSYPPIENDLQIPRVEVSLDDPATTRWDSIVKPRAEKIQTLINTFMKSDEANRTVVRMIMSYVAEKEMSRFPTMYRDELMGISKITNVDIGSLFVMNVMYELFGACTSIVAKGQDGAIWHGRNLDFGLFMGTNSTTHNWELTQNLRDLLVDVTFTRGGKTLYRSVTYAGFVGLLTASKAGGFSISVDTRFDSSLDRGILGWLLGGNNDAHFLTFQTRDVMENNETYADALNSLVSYKAMGPAYIILGGSKNDEGAVIAKQFSKTGSSNVDVWYLNESIANGSYYVLETNYDRKTAPPDFDDRRYPGMNCMDALDSKSFGAKELWGVMSSNPTRNAMTTFTSLMSPTSGHFEAYMQYCTPGPDCSPF